MQSHFDIVINGGGLAGNTLAAALAQNTSLNIAIIEPFPITHGQRLALETRTIALSHGTRRIYEALQFWSDLEPHTTAIQHIHVSDQGHIGMTRIHAKEQQMPALGYVIPITTVNQILQQKLSSYPTIQYLCPAKITEATLENQQWQILLQENTIERKITADLLIAADGGHAGLRALLGLATEEKDYAQTAIVTTIQLNRPHQYTAYERFIKQGALALLPVQTDICAVVVTLANPYLTEWQTLSDEEFLQRLQSEFGYRLGRFLQLGPRTTYPLKLVTTQQTRAQYFGIGNAAHTLHPIAAQSFNLSARDIAGLTELLNKHLAAGGKLSDPILQDNFAELRQGDQQRTVNFTDGLVEIFASPTLTYPRNMAMLSLDMVPPLKKLLGKYGAGTLGKLSRLARGLPV